MYLTQAHFAFPVNDELIVVCLGFKKIKSSIKVTVMIPRLFVKKIFTMKCDMVNDDIIWKLADFVSLKIGMQKGEVTVANYLYDFLSENV